MNRWKGDVSKKPPKKCHEIDKILILTSPNNSLQNAIKIGVF